MSYADMVREASSVILRACLVKILREDLTNLFSDKQKMNAYFAGFGLVRKKTPRTKYIRQAGFVQD